MNKGIVPLVITMDGERFGHGTFEGLDGPKQIVLWGYYGDWERRKKIRWDFIGVSPATGFGDGRPSTIWMMPHWSLGMDNQQRRS